MQPLCSAFFAVVAVATQPASATGAETQPSDPATIYAERCSSCHGKDLTGGSAQSMVDGVWQFGAGDWDLERNIRHGVAVRGMPGYQGAFSDDAIRGLVRWIRDAEKNAGAERPPLPETLLTRDYDVRVEKWIEGLETPWGLTFRGDDSALLTERSGRLRVVRGGKLLDEPVAGTPAVLQLGQGGLMDVAFDPQFEENGWVYLTYSEGLPDAKPGPQGEQPAMTRLVRGRIRDNRWVDEQTLFQARPEHFREFPFHFGSRIAFAPDGSLYFSIGERGHQDDAQDLARPNGKVHRINRDGSIPADNPFVGREGALPTIFSYGHRNPQGLAVHPGSGAVWETEHGPMGGDEVNLLLPGRNYGWPIASYGLNYNGTILTETTVAPGIEPPVHYWAPSIAVCGCEFVIGDEFPRWRDNLVVTGLGHEELRRLVVERDRVLHDEVLLKSAGRVRDVACSPSGAVYVVLNNPDVVLRLTRIARAIRQ